jgi:radical SAM protein with 4Fe4S-binding SPASM domain
MHSIQRPLKDGSSSSLLVQTNIRNLVLRDVPVMVQCIVTAQGLPKLIETVDDIASLGVHVIKFEAAKETAISRFQKGIEPDPIEYAQSLLDVIEYVCINYPGLMIDTGYFSEPSEDSYCGMSGVNTMLTPQGRITACLEVARLGDPFAEQLIYGELKDGKISIDREKQGFLEQLTYRNQVGGCNKCNLRMICHGGCPMEALWENGFPLRKSSFACKVEHYLLPRLMMMMAENPEIADVVANNADVN